MTTYAFHITVREGSELGVLTDALNLYIKHCHDEIAEGHKRDLYSKMKVAEKIKSCLYSNVEQTSGNNFFD
jgi:hypothetical protein